MERYGLPTLALWMSSAVALSALLTMLTIRYAHRRRMFDQPGQRRSHSVPTPRGGGIAIVAAILFCVLASLVSTLAMRDSGIDVGALHWLWSSAFALLMVAWVGWIDDRGGLSARIRFGAHWVAALVLLSPVLVTLRDWERMHLGPFWSLEFAIAVAILGMVLLAVVWSINLHNFMDGINGLLASQAMFVLIACGLLSGLHGDIETGFFALLAAAAVAGFLPFNFPRARIFMGDVGSGALGLLIALAVLALTKAPTLDLALAGLIACSAFVTDATATLLSRMLRGRRWYSAHREHLYQWLVRSGFQHASVVGLYMAWNLVVVVPAMLLIVSGRASMSTSSSFPQVSSLAVGALAAVYALAAVAWAYGKRYSLARVRAGSSHGIA